MNLFTILTIATIYLIGVLVAFLSLRKEMKEAKIWYHKQVRIEIFGMSLLSWFAVWLQSDPFDLKEY